MARAVIALATALALMLALGTEAFADHFKAICEVQASASAKLEKGYVLTVKLHTSDGKPVNETSVSFYEKVELFGEREMYLGSAVTDGQGLTSFAYLPAQLGRHEVIARSARKDHFLGAEGSTTIDATVAAASYRVAPAPLAAFSARVPYAAGAIVVAVWALLAFALFATARGVLGGARVNAQRKGDQA